MRAALLTLCTFVFLLNAAAARADDASSEADETPWSLYASTYAYFLPDDASYVQPELSWDSDWLHVEMRYNYEDQNTGSLWFGYNFSVGETVTLDLTPMFGGVIGNTYGFGPGLQFSLAWWWLEFYTEAEVIVATDDIENSFVYFWSELTLSPCDYTRLGLVAQRTRAYQSELEVQRGFLAGFSFYNLDLTAHLLNPDEDITLVFSFGINFEPIN